MIEDKATERWKDRMRKIGLIVNAGADKPTKPKTNGKDTKIGIKPNKKGNKK
jgi:hypothetical protein